MVDRYDAEIIVESILDNLQGRKGIGNAFDEIDEVTLDELKEDLIEIVMNT